MKELIDKAAIVAEIEKRVNEYPCDNSEQDIGYHCALYEMQDFLNHLKVKEVDLEKELENLIAKEKAFITDNREVKYYNGDSFNHIYELEFIAKYFFELGLKSQKGE